jgi:glycerol-3-phosphate dehydrogenase (NAD(P)+)
LWCYEKDVADCINRYHTNQNYLPGIALEEQIHASSDMHAVLTCGASLVIEAVPVKFLRMVLEQAKQSFSRDQTWIITSKGIEFDTHLLPTEIIYAVFSYKTKKAVMAGPSFAYSLAQKELTAVTIAASDCTVGLQLQKCFANSYFRPYLSLDLIGTQIGAALKNVVTLGVGMMEGAGMSDNAKAFVFTRGLHEMVELAKRRGAQEKTLYGLSGVGDLFLTATGSRSRNLEVGKRLGRGESLDSILRLTGYIPEGINTVQTLHQMIQKEGLDLPVCQGIYDAIFSKKSLKHVLHSLMERPLEQECQLP